MLRRKYRPGNLKQEKEKKIARYLQSFLSQVRDPERRDPGKEYYNRTIVSFTLACLAVDGIICYYVDRETNERDDVATENARISDLTSKEVTDTKTKSRETDKKIVTIGLTTFDTPGTSKSHSNKKSFKSQGNLKIIHENKSTQMRQNLSTQRLHDNEEDDDSSTADESQRRPKYMLIGWDNSRSKLMVVLLILFILWAVIYFPLIGS